MSARIRRFVVLAVVAALALGVASCGGSSKGGSNGASNGSGSSNGSSAAAKLPACPIAAFAKATKPVPVTMWHAMTRANEESLVRLTDAFNASQSDVKVTLVNQTAYDDAFNKFKAGLTSGDLPDLVQIEDTALQQMIDTQAVLPAAACVKADGYDLSDHLKRVVDYYSVNDVLWPMPFNVSNPVFYYDKNAFRKAGLDPEKPPTTLAELEADARKVKAAGYAAGLTLKLDPWHLEQWSAKAGVPYVNNGNGRTKRATAVTFDSAAGKEIFTWLARMVNDGVVVTNSAQGPSAYDNLFAIGNGNSGMTIDTSAVLGTIVQMQSAGAWQNVDFGVAPLPGPAGKGGVLVGGAALYIVNKSAPEKQVAAWKFARFLNEPEQQATWSADTGYIPVRKAATTQPVLVDRWAKYPEFRVAYDQLIAGVDNVATAGPVIGAYDGVRNAVIDAEESMFVNKVPPEEALKKAVDAANEAIASYNARVGA